MNQMTLYRVLAISALVCVGLACGGCDSIDALGAAARMRHGGPDDPTRGDVTKMEATPAPTVNAFPYQ